MADPSEANRLTSASARGDLTEVKVILQNGADVNERNMFGRTALQVGIACLQTSNCSLYGR